MPITSRNNESLYSTTYQSPSVILGSQKFVIDLRVLSSILSIDGVKGIALESIVLMWCTHQIPGIAKAHLNMPFIHTLALFYLAIYQPYCPVVGRRPQHVVSKFAYLALFSARWFHSNTHPSRLSIVLLVFLVISSFRTVSRW